MSLNSMVLKALMKKLVKLVNSLACTFKYAPNIPTKPVYKTKTGIMKVLAKMRLTTKNLKGFVAETSIASICSVTFMEPNSAPIFEPTFPAAMRAVMSGAIVLTMAIETKDGNHEVAPKADKDGRDCFVKTVPVIKPVTETNNNVL